MKKIEISKMEKITGGELKCFYAGLIFAVTLGAGMPWSELRNIRDCWNN